MVEISIDNTTFDTLFAGAMYAIYGMRIGRKKWLLLIVIVPVAAIYILKMHRFDHTVVQDGWRLEYGTPLMSCPTCFGRIWRIEFNGRPVPMPQSSRSDNRIWFRTGMDTPVGQFHISDELEQWRFYSPEDRRPKYCEEPITAEDLKRGFYEVANDPTDGFSSWNRKKGTPEHWCFIRSDSLLWIDPLRLDEIDWDASRESQ